MTSMVSSPPANVDAVSGYRHYATAQVAVGRLIRTLREMDLPLTQIAELVKADRAQAEMLLREAASELDRRYARQKRAYHSTLLLMRSPAPLDAPRITERQLAAMTVVVHCFTANRSRFLERRRTALAEAQAAARQAGLSPRAENYCAFIDPLSEEDGQLELLLTVETPMKEPMGMTLRYQPAVSCAAVSVSGAEARRVAVHAGVRRVVRLVRPSRSSAARCPAGDRCLR